MALCGNTAITQWQNNRDSAERRTGVPCTMAHTCKGVDLRKGLSKLCLSKNNSNMMQTSSRGAYLRGSLPKLVPQLPQAQTALQLTWGALSWGAASHRHANQLNHH